MSRWGPVLRAHGRSLVGAMLFGTPFLYTMETWWLGWRMPGWLLLVYALVGLAVVMALAETVGFREGEGAYRPPPLELWRDFTDLLADSFLAGFLVLFAFGIIDTTTSLHEIVRLVLMQIVPLGLGAAIANHALVTGPRSIADEPFPRDVAIFAIGALFFVFPIAPTAEMERIAAHAGWWRMALLVALSLLLTYLVLYELEFRGVAGRTAGLSWNMRVGETMSAYGVALLVSFALLFAFGHFQGAPPSSWAQMTIVLSLAASLGGSAARVIA